MFSRAAAQPLPWPRIALWGRFDVARFGELLLPRIHEFELRRRLPGLRVLPFSPMGPAHPVALDGGLTALPLGTWSPGNAARLAAVADAVLVAGTDVLTTDDEALGADYGLSPAEAHRRRLSGFFLEGPQPNAPMAWSAVGVPFDFSEADALRLRGALRDPSYLSVRDDVSRRRLAQAGIERDVAVVPDPVALASRVFEPVALARRLDYLRFMEWFPKEGPPIVVQASKALVAHAESLAAVLAEAVAGRDIPILLLETEPADDGLVETLMPRLPPSFRVPASASLVDILAVFSGARCFIGDSVHGHIAALSFGVPSLFVTPGAAASALATFGDAAPAIAHPKDAGEAVARLLGQARADGLPASIAVRLESHFDALAELACRAQTERIEHDAKPHSPAGIALLRTLQDAELRLDATRDAWEARSEQIAALRLDLAERLESTAPGESAPPRGPLAFSQTDFKRLEDDLRSASTEIASLRAELQAALAEGQRLGADLASAQMEIVRAAALHQAALLEQERLGAEAQADANRRIAERDARLATSLAELEAMRAEFLRFMNLRLFRYTAWLRKVYASLRRRRGRMEG